MSKDILAIQAEQRILILRDQKVMLDFHLAELYGVETRALKQAVRRNPERFPADFMFELSDEESENLRSQTVISSSVPLLARTASRVTGNFMNCYWHRIGTRDFTQPFHASPLRRRSHHSAQSAPNSKVAASGWFQISVTTSRSFWCRGLDGLESSKLGTINSWETGR